MANNITILKIVPGKKPETLTIPHTLESLQAQVGGDTREIIPITVFADVIDPTLPSPDTELEEFTVTPNEDVLQELEADHEPLDNSFEIICIRTSNHVEPDEEELDMNCFN